jgi:hypothetical protein
MSKVLERIKKRIPIHTSIQNALMMDDYDDWKNGEYLGDMKKINQQTSYLCKEILEWIENSKPGLKETKQFIANNPY